MPTPESAAAFEKLVTTRNRLLLISKQLNEAGDSTTSKGFMSDAARYRDLQEKWNEAFSEFEAATRDFNSSVKALREQIDADE